MNTPVLTAPELADLMSRISHRAYNPHLRATGDTDAIILGQLAVLDIIADRTCGIDLPEREAEQIRSAQEQAGRAIGHLRLATLIHSAA
ncbi:hypothetical protein OVA24_16650 [Luteolibacter sp. SL250]|uniref:hypothetical protein n=1 Tax=Luteolibacter sp. SL250 TaxID=2995170 RepID=UPI002271149E|nr:hypothetical protein [Luteolibacter sp. SL250]WAC18862.1 hypothetical protein OVA24_16650 [Luteolibacter sp. SL250]